MKIVLLRYEQVESCYRKKIIHYFFLIFWHFIHFALVNECVCHIPDILQSSNTCLTYRIEQNLVFLTFEYLYHINYISLVSCKLYFT